MSDFNANMHQNALSTGTPIPKPLTLFKGPTSKGREGEGKRRKGKGDRR